MSVEENKAMVRRIIEEAVNKVPGVKSIISSSSIGASVIGEIYTILCICFITEFFPPEIKLYL